MGQRTRMGRAKTGGKPISRGMYRAAKHLQAVAFTREVIRGDLAGETHPGYLDDAGGRARFAAKHAGQPWVKYERTGQGSQKV